MYNMGIVIIYVYIVVGGHMLCICSCFNDADHMCVKQLPCEKKTASSSKSGRSFYKFLLAVQNQKKNKFGRF